MGKPRNSWVCSECNHKDVEVIDSRPTDRDGKFCIRRRRKCVTCGHRVTTYEIQVENLLTGSTKLEKYRTAFEQVVRTVQNEQRILLVGQE